MAWLVGLAWLVSVPGGALVDVTQVAPQVRLDMRYATAENFAHTQLYPVARCLLRPEVADMLAKAQQALGDKHPGYALLLKDCYRPRHVQVRLWDVVKNTRRQGYVADPNGPRGGSVHCFGAAVDVTVVDAAGHELDMGTPFDFLGHLAEPRREAAFLASGELTRAQVNNRQVLRDAMVGAGHFRSIPNEWWHFDAWQGAALRARYQILDLPLQ